MLAVLLALAHGGDTVAHYWQQQVAYVISAALDEPSGVLTGHVRISYVNRSPDSLHDFYVHQYLNAFRPGSRWAAADSAEGRVRFQHLADPDYAFERITRATVMGQAIAPDYPYAPDSTVAHWTLPRPLAPGDSMTVEIEWRARLSTVPRRQGRAGRAGRRFDFAQWYPKVVVYDRHGWEDHPLYPAGEFYGEFASYDVTLVLPADQVIGATGVPVEGDPGWEGAKADPMRVAAQEKGLKVYQLPNLKGPEAMQAMKDAAADIGIMAFVLQFAPQEFVKIPKKGTIQYHPSLLPKYRGPSSINWPIIRGDSKTGLSIFRPTDGLDEGPVILQKETPLGPDDTLGSVYFDRLFPMGVAAMIEAADLVMAGKHRETVQDETRASYEGWCRAAEARINWASHVDFTYNLIRGCNPAPGAWTTLTGKKLQIFDSRKHLFRTFGAVKGKIGEISEIGAASFFVTAQGGRIEVLKAKHEDGKKVSAAELVAQNGLTPGTVLGS